MRQQTTKLNKKNVLLQSQRDLFHIKDLALLWALNNQNTLHTTVSRYIKNNTLFRIQKGFYSKVPFNQINNMQLGISFLHSYSYISTETILAKHGVISQDIPFITLISDKSKKFNISNQPYISRKLKDLFLLNQIGIIEKNGIKQATLERAVADMLYFNPRYHFDAQRLIDWQKVELIQKAIGYKIYDKSKSKKSPA